ncbi:MAG: anti-sigma factor [Gallionellaceae bacterium]|jgi:anti-sigma factor RsiW
MNRQTQLAEDDLHAYVDGRLDAARRAEVEAWLLRHPSDASRVAVYRQQNDALQALFNPVLNEPLPLQMYPQARHRNFAQPLRYAAMISGMVLSGLLGWGLHGAENGRQPPMAAMVRQAALAHVVYTPEMLHPVEVGRDQEQHLVKWLSKRLGSDVQPPHLAEAGYELMGGRLLPGSQGPAAQFMYQDARGLRLTLYLSNKPADKGEAAFRYAQEGKVSVFYWIDGDLSYALSGEVEKADLLRVATAVYQELNR